MKIKNWLFSGAFMIAILAAFALKAPSPKLANNAAIPGACATLVANCPGGSTVCTFSGSDLKLSVAGQCTSAAFKTN
jgi:hypothetical protein